MTWQQRVAGAAYKSPGSAQVPAGTRTEFLFEDVSRELEKKTVVFDFPDVEGTLVQDFGPRGIRYPIRCFFTGDDHDKEADAFALTLLEVGVGVLEHPRWGNIAVTPLGKINQRDDLKTAANQSIFEISFMQTFGKVYSADPPDPGDKLDDHGDQAAKDFDDSLKIDKSIEKVSLINKWKSLVKDAAQDAAEANALVTGISNSITQGLDDLVDDPFTLAFQTLNLLKAPGQTLSLIKSKLEGYKNLIKIITGLSSDADLDADTNDNNLNVISITPDNRAANELAANKLFSQGAVSGAVAAAVEAIQAGGYTTRDSAVEAAVDLIAMMDDITEWSDQNHSALEIDDTGTAYQILIEAVSLAANVLVVTAGGLKQEIEIILDRPRSVLDLIAEHYDSVDENIDNFILANDLVGDELLEIPIGRKIVVYI